MHCLALISAVDPLLVDLTALALHGQDALVLTASLHAGDEDDVIRLTAAQVPIDGIDGGAQTPPAFHVARTSECWTCSLREVLVAIAEDRARLEPDGATVVLLPPGVELIHLAPRLADDLARIPGAALAGLAHVIDVDTAARDLLTHQAPPGSVAAVEGQCAGELHMVALGYADVVVALGRDPVGRDLVEHLRPHDTLLLPGLDAPLLGELLALRHDAVAAVARLGGGVGPARDRNGQSGGNAAGSIHHGGHRGLGRALSATTAASAGAVGAGQALGGQSSELDERRAPRTGLRVSTHG